MASEREAVALTDVALLVVGPLIPPDGYPFEAVLAAAVAWGVDLVVMGRPERRTTGRPYVGSGTEHLLELTPVPAVVVTGTS